MSQVNRFIKDIKVQELLVLKMGLCESIHRLVELIHRGVINTPMLVPIHILYESIHSSNFAVKRAYNYFHLEGTFLIFHKPHFLKPHFNEDITILVLYSKNQNGEKVETKNIHRPQRKSKHPHASFSYKLETLHTNWKHMQRIVL